MAIDGDRIIRAVMLKSGVRDSKGIMPIFGVYLSLNYMSYYNEISFEFERAMGKERREEAEELLVAAAQECGYATFHGIRTSAEWETLVQPMIETDTDRIHAFAAIAVALGWGELVVEEIVPHERLVIQARNGYEADGYLQNYGTADSGRCYMLRGVTAGFMDLLYGPPYPDGCFAYEAKETRCRAMGAPYCEFIAQKKSGNSGL